MRSKLAKSSVSNLTAVDGESNRPRILVVDDSDEIRAVFLAILESAGYQVLTAKTGEECLQLIDQELPNLILLDVVLPDISGTEICKQLKNEERTAGVLVIQVSGIRTSPSNEIEGLEAGADAYLRKPVEPSVLLAHVRALLRSQQSEEALHRVSKEFKAAFESTFDGLFIVDDSSECIDVNPAACELLGLTRERIIGKRLLDLFETGLYWDLEVGWQDFLTQGHQKGELRLVRRDETPVYLEYDAKAHFLANRNLWVVRDIGARKEAERAIQEAHDQMEESFVQRTAELMAANVFLKREINDRKKAEEALMAATTEWEQTFNAMPDQLCIMDLSGVILRANTAMRDRFEPTLGNLIGLDHRLCYGGSEEHDVEPFQKTIREGIPLVVETAFPALEGSYLVAAYPLFDSKGKQWGAVSAVRDITERKRARQALRESEERYQLLIEGIPDYAIFMLDRNGVIVSWNEGARRIHGYEDHEIIGKHFSFFYTPEERDAGKADVALKAAIVNERYEEEGWRIAKDGTKFWANATMTALRDDEGNLRGFSKVTRNITDQKLTQMALREAEEKYRGIFENAIEGIFQSTPDGRFISANPAMARIFGYSSAAELINDRKDIEREHYVDPKRRRVFKTLIEEKGMVHGFELEAYRKDRTRIWTAENVRAVRDDAGNLLYYEGIVEDVTQRKLVENERVELLRRLVTAQEDEQRRISRELHDHMGQSLAAVLLGLKSLKVSMPAESVNKSIEYLQTITTRIADEMHSLIRELRPPSLDDLGLQTALSNYLAEWSQLTTIAIDFHANGLLNGRLDNQLESTIYRIVQESVNNVVKHAKAQNISVILEKREDRISVIVEDDGVGFDSEALLKMPAKNRRFGLLGMQERVTLVGGSLDIESTPGHGTTVIVHIPTSPNGVGAKSV